MDMTEELRDPPLSSHKAKKGKPQAAHLPSHDLVLTRTTLEKLVGVSLPDRVELWPAITLRYEVDGTVLPQGYSGLRASRVPLGAQGGDGEEQVSE
jgi:hypothetical protein